MKYRFSLIFFLYLFLPTAILLSAENFYFRNTLNSYQINLDDYADKILYANIYLKAITKKTNYYVGEQIILEYYLYVNDEIILTEIIEEKSPDFKDVLVEEEDIGKLSYNYETINNQLFRVALLRRYILLPSFPGQLKIPALSLKINAMLKYSPEYTTFEKYYSKTNVYSSPEIILQINQFENPPVNFSGAVGKFNLLHFIQNDTIYADQNFMFTLLLTGKGNFYLINPPNLNLPENFFLASEPIISDSIVKKNGLNGTKKITYILGVSKAGNYHFPEQNFIYFDPDTRSYVQLKTQPFELTVLETQSNEITTKENYTNNSHNYLYFIIVITLIFILFLIFRKSQNTEKIPSANYKLNDTGDDFNDFKNQIKSCIYYDRELFLDFLFKTFIEFLIQKVNISKTSISTDNIKEMMSKKGIDAKIIEETINFLDELKKMRFYKKDAPIDIEKMKYQAVELITKIEKY